MKKMWGLLGLVAACAACCAIPLAVPLLGGLLAGGAGLAMGWECGAVLALLVVGYAVYRYRQSKAKQACAAADAATGCGCASPETKKGLC